MSETPTSTYWQNTARHLAAGWKKNEQLAEKFRREIRVWVAVLIRQRSDAGLPCDPDTLNDIYEEMRTEMATTGLRDLL